jgi:hypothetical protein
VIKRGMSTKDEEYLRQAQNAEKQAHSAKLHTEREAWLRIAQGWMSMVRKRPQTATESFDAQSKAVGTGQEDSEASN